MPLLRRLRFEAIGHRDARLDPLLIDLSGPNGDAQDSTLWLRNGGGKSSILNLFFALVRPDRRDFLGAGSEGGIRRLEDYTEGKDTSHVVAEWQLDQAQGSFFGGFPCLLTGMILEWRNQARSDDPGRLRRVYWMALASSDSSGPISFDTVPVFSEDGEHRLSLYGFLERLKALSTQMPELRIRTSERVSEWVRLIDRFGLDSDLFRYQILMNRREGAADELFHFPSADAFIDFLLNLLIDQDQVEQVARNLFKHREQLSRRPLLDLEQQFVDHLLQDLGELNQLKGEEEDMTRQMERGRSRAALLHLWASRLQGQAKEQTRVLRKEATQAKREAEDRRVEAQRADAQAKVKDLLKVQWEVASGEEEVKSAKEASVRSQRQAAIQEAGLHLRALEQSRATVAGLESQVFSARSEMAPLLRELEATGSLLTGALSRRLQVLNQQVEELRENIVLEEREERKALEASSQAEASAQAIEARIDGVRRNQRAQSRQLQALVKRGVLWPDEPVRDGMERLKESMERCQDDLERVLERRERLKQRREVCQERSQQLAADLAGLAVQEKGVRSSLMRAWERRKELESDHLLRAILEAQDIDLDEIEELDELIEGRTRSLREQLVRERLAVAQEERALAALEDHGLLPPSADVEAILSLLSDHGIKASSGWNYLSHSVQRDDQRPVIQAHPDLAMGVMVSTEELERVQRILHDSPLHLSVPVRVGSPEMLFAPDPALGFVVGPSSRALFDSEEASEEMSTIRTRMDLARGRIGDMEEQLGKTEQLLARVKNFMADRPLSWFKSTEAKALSFARDMDRFQLQRDEIKAEIADLDGEDGRLAERERALRVEERGLGSYLAEADAFTKAQGTAEVVDLGEDQLSGEVERFRQEAEASRAVAEERKRIIETARDRLEAFLLDRSQLKDRFKAVRYKERDEEGEPQAANVSLQELAARYEALERSYEGKMSQDALAGRLDGARSEMKRAERTLSASLEERGLIIQDLAEVSQDLEEEELRATLRSSRLEMERAQAALGAAKERRSAAKANLKRLLATLEQEGVDISSLEAFPILPSEAALLKERTGAEGQAEELRRRARELEQEALALEARSLRIEADAQRSEVEARELRALVQRIEDWKGEVELNQEAAQAQLDELKEMMEEDVSALEAEVAAIREKLERMRRVRAAVRAQQEAATSRIRKWASDSTFAALPERLRSPFMSDEQERMVELSGSRAKELELRQRALGDELAELNKHHILVVDEVRDQVVEALRVLSRVSDSSRLPATVPYWSGQRFLKLRFKYPGAHERQRERLGHMIDSLTSDPAAALPSGHQLVKLGVRQLVGESGFDIQILKPDPMGRSSAYPIRAMASFSRGEQLTAAILLYCTLAKLRARNRGQGKITNSVLLLDNPIGVCSNVQLLDLQAQVAHAMGIQLLYTTGVNDLDAIATLPNVVRLRNASVDRRGDRHITVDDSEEGRSYVSAVKVTRRVRDVA